MHPTDRSTRYDQTTRRTATVVGALFLTATLTFGVGNTLIQDTFGSAGGAATISLALGVALLSLCAVAVVWIGAALVPVLGQSQRPMALGHLVVRVLEGVAIVALGTYMLGTHNLVDYEPYVYVFTGVAGLLLSVALQRSRLIPSWLAKLGVVGYLAILLAAPSDLLHVVTLDSTAGMLFYVPGGMFELLLPILLIARGFRRTDRVAVSAALERPAVAAT